MVLRPLPAPGVSRAGVFSSYSPDRTIAVEDLPTLAEILQNGLGAYLAPPGGKARPL